MASESTALVGENRSRWRSWEGTEDESVEIQSLSPISEGDEQRQQDEHIEMQMGESEEKPTRIKPQSWTHGVQLCGYATLGIMGLNIVFTVITGGLASRYSGNFETATIYTGTCSSTRAATIGLHLVINILGTSLLAMSSYCMQGLTAPSRGDVDRAHAKRTWLHIGTNSINNVQYISARRIILWTILLVTSLPIHLIYNSAILSTTNINGYETVIASSKNPDLVKSARSAEYAGCWQINSQMTLDSFAAAYEQKQYESLSVEECYKSYQNRYTPNRGLLVFLVDYNNTRPTDRLFHSYAAREFGWSYKQATDPDPGWQNVSVPGFSWSEVKWNISVLYEGMRMDLGSAMDNTRSSDYMDYISAQGKDIWKLYDIMNQRLDPTTLNMYLSDGKNWHNASWASEVHVERLQFYCSSARGAPPWDGDPVLDEDYEDDSSTEYFHTDTQRGGEFKLNECLAFPGPKGCQLRFSPAICLVVILCNLIKAICMFLASKKDRGELLLTMGDAIASFLDRPDSHTEGYCLLSSDNISSWSRPGWVRRLTRRPRTETRPRILPRRKWWWQAVAFHDWLMTFIVYLGVMVAGSIVIHIGLQHLHENGQPDASVASLGFRTLIEQNLIRFTHDGSGSPLLYIILSNLPQLLLSIAYFFYNRNLTSMVLAAEYDRFALHHHPLRVSWPKGAQLSTYFLTLSYRYSIPLIVASILLHWLVSESFFFVMITHSGIEESGYGSPEAPEESMCAWSPIAIICAVCVGFSMFVVIFVLGWRRMKGGIPLARDCSAAISAACHPPPDEQNPQLKAVRWGEVPADGEYAHCSFSSEKVEKPSGRFYL